MEIRFMTLFLFIYITKPLSSEELNPYTEALRNRSWKSLQKFIEVRPGAHLFYWLYYADGTETGAGTKPLIIWIQGGPGLAATGIANFAEIGPLNMNMQPRNHTWVQGHNVLLIDHPVGTGFSYVKNISLMVKSDREVATDLSKAIKVFFRRHKEFRYTPTYIFGQSYGGKICPRLAFYLHTAITKKRLEMNFKGIGIGSGWVSPRESSAVYPEYLYNMGAIGLNTYITVKNMSKILLNYLDKKNYAIAGKMHMNIFETIRKEAVIPVNFNNIFQDSPYPALGVLERKINMYVKPTLSHVVDQSFRWSFWSDDVWISLYQSFLVPSVKFLEMILNDTHLKVAVYNGNLDIVTPLAGASNWVHKLKWAGAQEFMAAKLRPIEGKSNGFYKEGGHLSFWSVFGSGHWIPEDNPVAMRQILEHMTGNK